MNEKRYVALLLALVIAFAALAGCDDKKKDNDQDSTPPAESSTTRTDNSPNDPKPAEDTKDKPTIGPFDRLRAGIAEPLSFINDGCWDREVIAKMILILDYNGLKELQHRIEHLEEDREQISDRIEALGKHLISPQYLRYLQERLRSIQLALEDYEAMLLDVQTGALNEINKYNHAHPDGKIAIDPQSPDIPKIMEQIKKAIYADMVVSDAEKDLCVMLLSWEDISQNQQELSKQRNKIAEIIERGDKVQMEMRKLRKDLDEIEAPLQDKCTRYDLIDETLLILKWKLEILEKAENDAQPRKEISEEERKAIYELLRMRQQQIFSDKQNALTIIDHRLMVLYCRQVSGELLSYLQSRLADSGHTRHLYAEKCAWAEAQYTKLALEFYATEIKRTDKEEERFHFDNIEQVTEDDYKRLKEWLAENEADPRYDMVCDLRTSAEIALTTQKKMTEAAAEIAMTSERIEKGLQIQGEIEALERKRGPLMEELAQAKKRLEKIEDLERGIVPLFPE